MDNLTRIVLLDNGSLNPEATLGLRRVASKLADRIGRMVDPVSARYADRVAPESLEGVKGRVWATFLEEELLKGNRRFLVLPLFFGDSDALVGYISEAIEKAKRTFGDFQVEIAKPLVDLNDPEDDLLARLIVSMFQCSLKREADDRAPSVVLVDHGSPNPLVTECRNRVASQMAALLGGRVASVLPCSMERRAGEAYAFNDPMLADLLDRMACDSENRPIYLCYMFLFPGRHAGKGGDIEQIVNTSAMTTSGRQLKKCPLIGESEDLAILLEKRFGQLVDSLG